MVINENSLCQLVLKVLEKLQNEEFLKQNPCKKNLAVILTGDITEDCFSFFSKLKETSLYNVFTVIPQFSENEVLKKLIDSEACGKVLKQNDVNFEKLPDFLTVFPIVPRDLIVKTALCISDTFETKWIKYCISNGRKIIMLKSGLEKFTGKEPKAYVNKISEYYRIISEYGIAVKDDIFENYKEKAEYVKSSGQWLYGYDSKKKKIITENELDRFCTNNKILLNSSDIITELAKEKADKLGIDIIRT